MRSVASFCVAVLVSGSVAVLGQPTETMSARDHYRKGTQYYDLQRFDDAAREYEAAFQAKEDPALLFNIGQSYRFAKKYEPAAGAFRSYLRRLPSAPNRAQVESILVELTKLAEDQRKAAEEEAKRAAEEKRIAEEQARQIALAEAEAKARQAELAVLSAPQTRQPDPLAAARGRKMKIAGIAVAAVGGAALISGAGLLGAAGAISNRYNNLTTSTQFDPDDERRWKTFRLTGAVLAGVGGAAAIAGAAVAVLGARKQHENRVVWAPSVAPGWAGVTVSGGW